MWMKLKKLIVHSVAFISYCLLISYCSICALLKLRRANSFKALLIQELIKASPGIAQDRAMDRSSLLNEIENIDIALIVLNDGARAMEKKEELEIDLLAINKLSAMESIIDKLEKLEDNDIEGIFVLKMEMELVEADALKQIEVRRAAFTTQINGVIRLSDKLNSQRKVVKAELQQWRKR